MWFLFALGSAVFAALTSILEKIGIGGVGSNLATAIRTAVVLILAWGMVFLTNEQGACRHQPEELAVSDSLGARHRSLLAVLLPGPANRGCVQGGSRGQAQHRHHPGSGLCPAGGEVHLEVCPGGRPHYGGNPRHDSLKEALL